MNAIIKLTTDFGTDSPYVAAMKGVILSRNPAAKLVDVTHAIPPQDVRHGAIVWNDMLPWFPRDAIHIGVVDPGVGTERPLVYVELGGLRCLAPDNGLLSLLAGRFPPTKIVRLTKSEFWLSVVSATFHGRDILAPVAAQLSLGLNPDLLGVPHGELRSLAWPEPQCEPGRILGEVWASDSFGSLLTNIPAAMVSEIPDLLRATVNCHGCKIAGISRTYGERQPGHLIALIGSSGRLEIAVVNGNAAITTGAIVGAPVEVTWQSE